MKDKKLNVGKETVIIGDVSGNFGDRCVIIGATDDRGNVILNRPMAVGYKAHAGPNSISIGAYAGAGSETAVVLSELNQIIEATADQSLIESFKELCSELKKDKQDRSKISRLWNIIKEVTTVAAYLASVT